MRILRYDQPDFSAGVEGLLASLRRGLTSSDDGSSLDVPSAVREIIDDVSARGDAAIADCTARLEGVTLAPDQFRVSDEDIAAAHDTADEDLIALIRRAGQNIREYQEHIRHRDPQPLRRGGRELTVRYRPLRRAGVYVPGGKAVYPSTVLMTVIPAQVAGVEEIVLVSPPTGGDISPLVLALAGELGIDEVYRVSGTAGVASMAIGTGTIAPVDKIVGPGNAFIAEAKRQLLGRVGIDSIAGPSEVVIVADATARADWLAADLLAQAEHNPGSSVLITPEADLAAATVAAVENQLADLPRAQETRYCLESYGAAIVTEDLSAACELAGRFAAEHLQVITADPERDFDRIGSAGAAFLGPHTPVPLGDYYAGPSHVLPTGTTARFFGPLSVNDFLSPTSVLRYDEASLAEDADDVAGFARREGLEAHARAVDIRRRDSGGA